MSKHTPGPWTTPSGLALSRHKAGKPIDCEIPVTAGNRPIAFVSHYCAEEGMNARITERNRMEMQEANARLMAAAPDLLEALKEFVADYIVDDDELSNEHIIERMYDRATAAIKKAEEEA